MEKENERELLVKTCKELLKNKSLSIRTSVYGELMTIYTNHLINSNEINTSLVDSLSYKIVICRQFEVWLSNTYRFNEKHFNGTETGDYKLSITELRYIINNIDRIVYRTFSNFGLDITENIDEYKWFSSVVSVFEIMMFEKENNMNVGTNEN